MMVGTGIVGVGTVGEARSRQEQDVQHEDDAHPGSLAALVAEQAATAGDAVWAQSARGSHSLDRAALARLATTWAAHGVAGRRLALLASDPVAFAGLFVSLVAGGATVVPLDPNAPAAATRTLLATARTTGVVTVTGERAPLLTDLTRDGAVDVLRADAGTLAPAPAGPGQWAASSAERADRDGASLLFSSGSTGTRKAMRLGERQLMHVAASVASAHDLGPADRCLNPLPLFHVNAEVVGLLATLASGGAVVLDDRFHRTGFWQLVADRDLTWVNAVPAIIAILAGAPPEPPPTPRLRFVRSASAPLALPVLERFEAVCGVPVVETYGMTEAASQITANPLGARRRGTVGTPVGVDLRVLTDRGTSAGAGLVGRVQLRGPGVITAYEGGVGADRFDADGWLDTGDMGSLDDDGYLTLAGRSDDIINRGGEKIFPREVEDVLREDPAVTEAVVVGRPHPVLGHVPVAYVIAAPDAPPGLADALVRRCEQALPRPHRPVELHVVADLPLGPTGKLSRRLVAETVDAPAQAPAQVPAQAPAQG